MKNNKPYRLGELIEPCDERNSAGKYTVDDVRGISTDKMFIETKANMDGISIDSYKVVNFDAFAYVADTSRRGDKIAIAYNKSNKGLLISSIYTTFNVCKTKILDSDYLFMFCNRPEFDRYSRFNSWGSARETFSWEDFCDITITLPPLIVQQKYVAVYKALQKNLAAYENGLEDLKLTCDGFIDKIKNEKSDVKDVKHCRLCELIIESDLKNTDMSVSFVNGVNKEKSFIPTVAAGEDLTKYKIVQKNQFACNLMHIGRDVSIPIAMNTSDKQLIVSPAYIVFSINSDKVLPEYAQLWLSRNETGRYAWFLCDSSVRSGMEKDRFFDIEIPLPSIDIQQDIVNIYNVYIERQRIAAELRQKIKTLCPLLIKGSLEE
jgi:type I restriction enzyme S subunit